MKFLADQDVYGVTTRWLRGKGYDVVVARDLGLERASDGELLSKAQELGRVMLTRDKGFGALIFLRPEKTLGVILVRGNPGTIEEVHRELECLFEEHKEEELKGLFCVVEPGRHRIRHLPGK